MFAFHYPPRTHVGWMGYGCFKMKLLNEKSSRLYWHSSFSCWLSQASSLVDLLLPLSVQRAWVWIPFFVSLAKGHQQNGWRRALTLASSLTATVSTWNACVAFTPGCYYSELLLLFPVPPYRWFFCSTDGSNLGNKTRNHSATFLQQHQPASHHQKVGKQMVCLRATCLPPAVGLHPLYKVSHYLFSDSEKPSPVRKERKNWACFAQRKGDCEIIYLFTACLMADQILERKSYRGGAESVFGHPWVQDT